MALQFYYGSGSPFSWNVWLTLEHKQIPYELKLMSLQSGDLKRPDYLAINPRGKVPTVIDGDVAVWETLTIIEYLEERYPQHSILPAGLNNRTTARRLAAEAYSYLYPVLRKLMEQTLFRPDDSGDSKIITEAKHDIGKELDYFEERLSGDYFAGRLSMADFTLYPLLALIKRLHEKQPEHQVGKLISPKLERFMQRVEQLPYFGKTYPPHWQG